MCGTARLCSRLCRRLGGPSLIGMGLPLSAEVTRYRPTDSFSIRSEKSYWVPVDGGSQAAVFPHELACVGLVPTRPEGALESPELWVGLFLQQLLDLAAECFLSRNSCMSKPYPALPVCQDRNRKNITDAEGRGGRIGPQTDLV